MMRMLNTRRRWVAVGLGGCLVVAVVSVAFAAGGGPASYTGCLSTTGAISKVQKGSTPVGGACPTGSTTIKLSGGDITGVAAGTGLTGGATSGAAAVGVAPGYSLPQSCAAGEQPAANGSGGWMCVSGPQAINIDLPETEPPTFDVAVIPGGFQLRLTCEVFDNGRGLQQRVVLEAKSATDGEVNYVYIFGEDVNVANNIRAFGTSLPAGIFQTINFAEGRGCIQNVNLLGTCWREP